MKLPSQKLFLVFIPLILLFGIFATVRDKSGTHIVKSSSVKVVSVQNSMINTVDTDGDGVPDWEEVIWHTDPKNPKTFGIGDKDYITKKIAEKQNDTSSTNPISDTEELSHQLFTEYVKLQKSGQLNDQTVQAMAEQITNNIVVKDETNQYTEKDIKTFPDSDKTKIQAYANSLMRIESEYSKKYMNEIGDKGLSPEDPSFSKNMTIVSNLYSNLAKAIIQIPCPKGASLFHLGYINSIQTSAGGMKKLSNTKTDPLNSLLGIQKHLQAQSDQATNITGLANFLTSNGIVGFTLDPL